MALELNSFSSIEDVLGLLDDIEVKHVPFAFSQAINSTLFEARTMQQQRLEDVFTLRRPWVRRGLRVRKSNKRKLEGVLFTADWFMAQQEEGARRRPLQGRNLFVPLPAIRRGGTKEGLPTKRPKTLLKQVKDRALKAQGRKRRGRGKGLKPTPFIASMDNGKKGIFIRTSFRSRPIVLLYAMEDAVDIPPVWRFQETNMRFTHKHLRREFIKAMQNALATDKRGARRSRALDHLRDYDGAPGGSLAGSGGVLGGLRR